jgi:hypothetical protein
MRSHSPQVGYYAKQAVDRLQNTILVGERELAPSHAELTGTSAQVEFIKSLSKRLENNSNMFLFS